MDWRDNVVITRLIESKGYQIADVATAQPIWKGSTTWNVVLNSGETFQIDASRNANGGLRFIMRGASL